MQKELQIDFIGGDPLSYPHISEISRFYIENQVKYAIDEDQHFQLDPLTSPYILESFKRYDEGATMTEIRDWLNAKSVKNTRGQALTYNSVQHLLNNRRYIGVIVVPDGIPAIVPQPLLLTM